MKYEKVEEIIIVDKAVEENKIINLVLENNFDIILLDINIKKIVDIDGLELCAKILNVRDNSNVVILTGYDYYAFEKEAKKIGAMGFLNKEIETKTLYEKLQLILKGHKIFKIQENKFTDLTKQELKIIKLYAQGYSRNDIAKNLYISLRTLANHLNTIYEKLGVKNYQEMIHKATLMGYIKENIM
ncbi:MAG: response regulator transcription factor [Gallibacter sp.]|nr:response regulator transcription factor [Gallibacter sp.]